MSTGDELPEWATDDTGADDEGGTFDASGAFMSLKDIDEVREGESRKVSSDRKVSVSTEHCVDIQTPSNGLPVVVTDSFISVIL